MIWHNKTSKTAQINKNNYHGNSGRWEFEPINIAPGKYMACLHVKRDGAATGSAGNI